MQINGVAPLAFHAELDVSLFGRNRGAAALELAEAVEPYRAIGVIGLDLDRASSREIKIEDQHGPLAA